MFNTKYIPPKNSLFIKNRNKFKEKIKNNSLAIFFSNELIPVNADALYPFEQDSNFYYLTGIDQENCIFVLGKNPDLEILLIPYTDEHTKIWEGDKLTIEQANELSGISNIKYIINNKEFQNIVNKEIGKYEHIYLDFNEHPRATHFRETSAKKFAKFLQEHFPAHKIERSAPILYELRMQKEPEEIEQMKIACNITAETFLEILKIIKPGIYEYEIEAEIWKQFLTRRATKPAYQSIVATGKNACTLHYVKNNSQLKDGEMLLMDFGAEYGNYSADLSRTIPVNGKFTKKQAKYYDIVLKTLNYATSLLVPGNTIKDYNKKVREFLQEELLQVGLLKYDEVKNEKEKFSALSKYFMHGISHPLGLDTHDVHSPEIVFKKNMVFTCEPGIYIPEEGIGIRLENDILITENGNENLLSKAPIEREEIENLMNV